MARKKEKTKPATAPKILEKRYDSVSELVHASCDEQTTAEYEKLLESSQLIDVLMLLRNKAGLTQQDLAKKLDCTQSKVSKMEGGADADLRFGEIVAYAKATDHQMEILLVPKGQTLVNLVKMHASIIQRLLHQMVKLAGTDGTMTKGVAAFLNEATVNLVRFVLSAAKNLPELPEGESQQVRVEFPEDPADLDQEGEKQKRDVEAEASSLA